MTHYEALSKQQSKFKPALQEKNIYDITHGLQIVKDMMEKEIALMDELIIKCKKPKYAGQAYVTKEKDDLTLTSCRCLRCGCAWVSSYYYMRPEEPPAKCPHCRSTQWSQPRRFQTGRPRTLPPAKVLKINFARKINASNA